MPETSTVPRPSHRGGVPLLSETEWRKRAVAHEARVDAWVQPVLERRRRGEAHPVEDFLFTYYSQRPARLRRWSPGIGVVLSGPGPLPEGVEWEQAPGGHAVAAPGESAVRTASWVTRLLARTAARPAQFGCFGLH